MKYHVFTHFDVDGAVSYLLIKWFFPNVNISYSTSCTMRFREDWNNWTLNNNIKDYDKIFILDLDICDCADLIDHENVLVIDHHKSHNNVYKKAKGIIKEYSSAAKLCYKLLNKLHPDVNITDAQKKLILLTDDYDSYTLQLPDSQKLNIVFNGYNKKFESFIKNFARGFFTFNLEQQNMIKLHTQKIESIKNNIEVYGEYINIEGKKRKVVASFVNQSGGINEIADYLKDKFNADIAMIVNLKQQSVSIRRSRKDDSLDVSNFAKKLVDGGGHEYAAGGKITEAFLEFTKLLKQIK